jgi:hypothetical protein
MSSQSINPPKKKKKKRKRKRKTKLSQTWGALEETLHLDASVNLRTQQAVKSKIRKGRKTKNANEETSLFLSFLF